MIAEGTSKELKTNYLKNTILEIECEKVVAAMELLEKENFVDETSIFGNQIHVIVNDKFSTEDQIRDILNENSISVSRINKIIPTLEDVFIHLLDEKSK